MKVFISTYPFGQVDPLPLEILKKHNITFFQNPYNRKLTPQETKEFANEIDILIAGTEDLTPLVETSSKLKMISRVGIGLDSVPLELCKQKGILVSYTPDAVTPAVVEFTIGLMLNGLRMITFADREIRRGNWTRPVGKRLGECVVGIIGVGRVGMGVARSLVGFFPKKILVNDIINIDTKIQELLKLGLNVVYSTKEEIYQNSDVISLHIPLTQDTKNLITSKEFSQMKKKPLFINTSRGEIVNEIDLYFALKNELLSGACIDVYSQEPYSGRLLELENITLTQHMGSCSVDCRIAMETEASEAVIQFIQGKQLKNIVTL